MKTLISFLTDWKAWLWAVAIASFLLLDFLALRYVTNSPTCYTLPDAVYQIGN